MIVDHATVIYVTCTDEDKNNYMSHTIERMSMLTVVDAKSVDG